MRWLLFFPVTELNALSPRLSASKSTKVICFVPQVSPTERIGVCNDAKKQTFNKISYVREHGTNRRYVISPHD